MSPRYRVGLIGHGVEASLSPALHMREAAHLGLDYAYSVLDLAEEPDVDLGQLLSSLEEQGFDAVNVTYPYKRAALAHVPQHSDEVRVIGSANLIILRDGTRTAHNTDCTGFRAALEAFLAPGSRGPVLQLGAGGAGLATVSALIDMGFGDIVVHDRDASAVQALVERFATSSALRAGDRPLDDDLASVDGVVHATPTGMHGRSGVPFEVGRLRPEAWVAEVVYRPLQTELVSQARARGLSTLDGGAMAVGQAADSLRLITQREPDRARMSEHFAELAAGAESSRDR